jgi:hypothetical protein
MQMSPAAEITWHCQVFLPLPDDPQAHNMVTANEIQPNREILMNEPL